MPRFSVSTLTTLRWPLEDDLLRYRELKVEAIGLWRPKLSDFGEERAIERVRESGLAGSSLSWAGGFTGSDGRTYRESLDDARDALRLAAALRAESLIVYSGARSGHTHNHARRLFRGALSELAPQAEELGVTLAVEPIHIGCSAEWTFLNELEETLQLLTAVERSSVRLAFDAYHLCQNGKSLDRIAEAAPHVALVQLGDAKRPPTGEPNRCRLGDGVLPLREVVAAFEGAGYRGYYEVELMGEDVEASDYCELIKNSQRAFERLIVAN